MAAVPATAGASVSGAASGTASAAQAKAAAPHPAPAALRLLEQRARLAARARGARGAAAASVGAITGTVLGANRRPVPGACVTAVGPKLAVTATASASGTFALSGLAPGSYALEYRDCAAAGRYFTAWSGSVAWRSAATHVHVAAYQSRHVPAVILKPTHAVSLQTGAAQFQRALAAASGRGLTAAAAATTGRIAGLITGNGKPLANICVVAFPVNGGVGYGATSGTTGRFTIRYMRPGKYDVIFAGFCTVPGNWLPQAYRDDNNPFAAFGQGGPTPVKVISGAATRGINAQLRRGGEISGTVTSKSGAKLGGICVNVTGDVPGGQIGSSGITASDGRYQLHALFPGKYFLQFVVGCGSAGNYAPASHLPIKIGYGTHVSGVNEVLGPGASVTGTVTLGTSSGQPLAGMCVGASNADGSIQMQTQTDAQGNYSVIGLGPGAYQLQIGPGCNNNGNYTSTVLTVQTTAGQQTSGANAVLQPGATISGTVTDSKSRPVPNMCIELGQLTASSQAFGFNGSSTAGDGTYLVNQLAAGSYVLGVDEGCGNTANYAPWWYADQTDMRSATPIVLATAGSQVINPQLKLGAAIAGTLTNASGRALPGICVDAVPASGVLFGPTGFAVTGALGRYDIPALAPGQYKVDFGCQQSSARFADQWFDGADSQSSADAVSATPGRTMAIDGVLRPAGAIGGSVTGPSGQPLAGICVGFESTTDAAQSGLGVNFQTQTNRHGAYQLTGLAAGSYYVQFQVCQGHSQYAEQWYRHHGSTALLTPVRVIGGQTTSGIDARLAIGGILAGRTVSSSATPVPGVCVFAFTANYFFFGFGTSGANGSYQISGLPTGNYTVTFSPCSNENLVSVLSPAKVTAPHTTGLNATMLPGGSVSGVVTVANTGQPLSLACVEVVSSDPNNLGSFAATGSDGSYTAAGLAAGTYQVYFGDPLCSLNAPGLAPQWYNDQASQATANPITVTVGQTTPAIDAALHSDGQITGAVTGPGSAPLAGICVTAVPFSPNLAGSPSVVAVSRTGGGYRLIGLLPGQYTVRFSAGCGTTGYQTQWWQDAGSAATATPVSVAPDQVVPGVNATLST